MKGLLLTAAFLLVAAPSYANCDNYTDGSTSDPAPRAILCFKGKCDDTTVNNVCSSGFDFSKEYANGLEIYKHKTDKDVVFTNELGNKMRREDWTCKEIGTSSDGACW
jgi:hypothetical protein